MSYINYERIVKFRDFYINHGYKYIEGPWMVPTDICNITKPDLQPSNEGLFSLSYNSKSLIASGEQGFLDLMRNGNISPGKYQTITPCFRNDRIDRLHQQTFMKLELINILREDQIPTDQMVYDILNDAKKIILMDLQQKDVLLVDNFDDNDRYSLYEADVPDIRKLDIYMNTNDNHPIELGSYGARTSPFGTWIYGTGLAEPRFSTAKKIMLRNLKD